VEAKEKVRVAAKEKVGVAALSYQEQALVVTTISKSLSPSLLILEEMDHHKEAEKSNPLKLTNSSILDLKNLMALSSLKEFIKMIPKISLRNY
jgi:hypothetical protein